MNTQITVKNLSKLYGKNETVVKALYDCNVVFEKGEFTAIIGASGSGKSTLLNLLGGLETADSGHVYYDNMDILALNDSKLSEFRRQNIGFVFQFFNLIPELTAYENIVLPIMMAHQKPEKEYLNHVIEILGLSERLHHYPTQLSGGQQQRVAIARALITHPRILLCDEPTGNLDEKTGNDVIELLIKLNRSENCTVIIVTHNPEIAKKCDRVIEISDGKIVS